MIRKHRSNIYKNSLDRCSTKHHKATRGTTYLRRRETNKDHRDVGDRAFAGIVVLEDLVDSAVLEKFPRVVLGELQLFGRALEPHKHVDVPCRRLEGFLHLLGWC